MATYRPGAPVFLPGQSVYTQGQTVFGAPAPMVGSMTSSPSRPLTGTSAFTQGQTAFRPGQTAFPPSNVATGDQLIREVAARRAAQAQAEAMAKLRPTAKPTATNRAKPKTASKPGSSPSTRGRSVAPGAPAAFKGASATGAGQYAAMNGATPAQMAALGGYLGYGTIVPTPAYGGATQAQIAALGGHLGYGVPAPAPTQAQIADFIASPAAVTGPVSPYASMNQYGGTSGPPAMSVQNSQQAAAIAARNATADQLASAEFRQTLNALLVEAGIAPQF